MPYLLKMSFFLCIEIWVFLLQGELTHISCFVNFLEKKMDLLLVEIGPFILVLVKII